VRRQAAKDNWSTQLEERISKQSKEVAVRLEESTMFNELEVRVRHALQAKLMSDIGSKRLNMLTDEDIQKISLQDAVFLLRSGISEERKALGLDTESGEPGIAPVTARVLSDDQVFAVARRVTNMKKDENGVYSVDEGKRKGRSSD